MDNFQEAMIWNSDLMEWMDVRKYGRMIFQLVECLNRRLIEFIKVMDVHLKEMR